MQKKLWLLNDNNSALLCHFHYDGMLPDSDES